MSDVNIQTFSGKVNVTDNFKVGTGHLFVDTQNNKVGLNTTTPEANLHVTGNTYISTDISVGGTLTMGTVTVEALHSLDAVTSVGNTTPHTVEFQNTDTSLVASGNVQANYFIGNGSELSNISLQQVTDAGNTTSNTLLLTNTDTSLVASGNVEIGTANLFVDTVTGRVGIGTDVPAYDFDVQSSSDAADKTMGRLYSRENATGVSSTGLIFEKGTGYGGVIKGFISQGIGSGLSLHTLNDGTEAQSMTIMNSGNVGIGTTDPSAPLDVPGGISTPGYHAQWSLSCAGLVTWTGSRLSWVGRVIAIPVEKTEFGYGGYIDMYVPASGTSITYYDGSTNTQTAVTTDADGFPLNAWEALWYVVTPGQSNSTVNSQYVITDYRNSLWKPNSNWLLIAFVNGDTAYEDHLKFIPTGGTFHVWTGLPFVNSWVNYSNGYNPGGYYRDGDGVVYLQGLIKSGTASTICTLPSGYRPGYRILTNGHTSSYGACRVDITALGEITLQHSTYSNTWVSLDGIHFKAEQ